MADDATENKGVEPSVTETAQDPGRQVVAGPKDPEHGERPVEYQERVDAATTVKGPAHLDPTTTHAWGGNSEFRSTGVIPMLPTLAKDLPVVDHPVGQKALPAPVPDVWHTTGFAAVAPPLPGHVEPTEENTKPE